MNINDYRRAMDKVAPDDTLKERIMNQKKKTYRPARRVLTVALAAALTAACLLTAAFAASPEFRTAVLSFLHMEEREQVPNQGGATSQPDISHAEIGELVRAQYIKMDDYYGLSGDLLHDLTWNDDRTELLDYKFWEIQDNELIPVQVDMNTSHVDIMFRDLHYQGEFYWFVRNDQLYFFSGNHRTWDEAGECPWDWNLSWIPGRTDAVFLNLSIGTQMEYTEYPFLYHLDTGEVEDILAGTGADKLEYAYGYDWSDNMRRAIILTGNRLDDQRTWFCDLDTGTLTPVDELTDIEIYTAAFADNDTLILYSTGRDEEWMLRDVSFYAYDIPTGQMTKTLDKAPYYRDQDENPSGVKTYGSRCVHISEDGQVQVVNLKTGVRTLLGGFTFQKGDSFMLNPAGDKLLYFSTDSESDGLGISQIGVADLDKGVFFAFDREGYENLHESGIGWSDDNTVSINAHTPDRETQYLLLYTF